MTQLHHQIFLALSYPKHITPAIEEVPFTTHLILYSNLTILKKLILRTMRIMLEHKPFLLPFCNIFFWALTTAQLIITIRITDAPLLLTIF